MVNARLCEKTRPAFSFASSRRSDSRRSDVIYKPKQTNRYIENLRDLSLAKKSKCRDSYVKKTRVRDANNSLQNRVRDTWNSTTMLRDPWVLRDNSSPHMYPDCKQISALDLPVRNFAGKVFLVYSCSLDFPCNRLVYHR